MKVSVIDLVFATRQSDSEPTCENPITNTLSSVGSVSGLAWQPHIPAMPVRSDKQSRLFKSFFGVYGWMRFDGEDIYYKIILLLNVSLIAYILFMLLKDKDKQVRFEAVVWVGVAVSMIIAVVYHCWAVDYQPQGRYLFGILPCWMHLASKRKVYDRVTAEYLLEAIALVSIFSFVRYGMIRFVA